MGGRIWGSCRSGWRRRGLPRVPYLSDFPRSTCGRTCGPATSGRVVLQPRRAVVGWRSRPHDSASTCRISTPGCRSSAMAWVLYHSERRDGRGQPARLDVRYRATRPTGRAGIARRVPHRPAAALRRRRPRSVDDDVDRAGPACGRPRQSSRSRRYRPRPGSRWPVHPHGLADRLDVVAWWPRRVAAGRGHRRRRDS